MTLLTALAEHTILVNESVISPADVQGEMQHHRAASPQLQWQEAARALVVRALLLGEARKKLKAPGFEDIADEEALIQALLEQEVRVPTPTDAELERWCAANAEHARKERAAHVRHILVYADKSLPGSLESAQKRAGEFLDYLGDHPQDFEPFAARYSECPSASRGGDLGIVAEQDLLPEFRSALEETEEGAFCAHPVETRYGVHVVQLLRRFAGQDASGLGEEEKHRIRVFLEDTSWKQGVQNYITMLGAQARIKGFDLFGGTTAQVDSQSWPDGKSCTGKK
ncbi:peptidylprolyl isomerase [Acetobacter cerevisiae]|uniref:peptidylprolyl isomerase n=1 Tax=Acetobacter cerevisiae TaxID=178900 RepID=UPI000784C393|nr:peptidylprolyl isomerase [Acetobacter cerevisiae]